MLKIDRSKPPKVLFGNGTGQVDKGPCLVVALMFTGTGANPRLRLYDGMGATAAQKVELYAVQNASFSPPIADGILFEKGVYAVCDAATTIYTLLAYRGYESAEDA